MLIFQNIVITKIEKMASLTVVGATYAEAVAILLQAELCK